MSAQPRRTLYIPDDTWAIAEQAAASRGAKEGKPLSVSAWIRNAIIEQAKREGDQ